MVHIKISFELQLSANFYSLHIAPFRQRNDFGVCVFILGVVAWKNECFNKISREKKKAINKMIYDLIIGYAGVMHQNVIAWVHEFKWFLTFYDVLLLMLFLFGSPAIQRKQNSIASNLLYCSGLLIVLKRKRLWIISAALVCVCVSTEKRKQTQIHGIHRTTFYSKP